MIRTLLAFIASCVLLILVDMEAFSPAHAATVLTTPQQAVCSEQASASSLRSTTRCTVYTDASHTKIVKYTQSVCTHKLLDHGSEVQTFCTNTVRYANGQPGSPGAEPAVMQSMSLRKLHSALH